MNVENLFSFNAEAKNIGSHDRRVGWTQSYTDLNGPVNNCHSSSNTMGNREASSSSLPSFYFVLTASTGLVRGPLCSR